MKLDKDGTRILKTLNTDSTLLGVYHVPEYLCGKLFIPIDRVVSQLEKLERLGFISWMPVEDGRQVVLSDEAITAYHLNNESRHSAVWNELLAWGRPVVVVVVADLIEHWLKF